MKLNHAIAAVIALALPVLTVAAHGAELKVFQGNALNAVMEELGPQFETANETKLVATVGTSAQLKARIENNEPFDITFITRAALGELTAQGKIAASPQAGIARAGIGVAIRKGAAKPDLSTVEAFKQAMLNAKSIGFVDQTPTGANLKVIFAKLGIADQMQPKMKPLTIQAAVAVANGDVELGFTQISEILAYPSVDFAGPLPADIQTYTAFAGGVSTAAQNAEAAAALIKFLTAPAATAVIKAKGMEPG
jgi:molybdate transport system substrate-binding protein